MTKIHLKHEQIIKQSDENHIIWQKTLNTVTRIIYKMTENHFTKWQESHLRWQQSLEQSPKSSKTYQKIK